MGTDLMMFAQDNEMNLSWLAVVGHKYEHHDDNDNDDEHNDNNDHNDSNDEHNDENDNHNDANDNADNDNNASATEAEEDEEANESAHKRRDNHSSEEHDDSTDEHDDEDKHNDHNDDKAMDNEWHMKWFDSNNYDYKSEYNHFNSEVHFSNWFPSEPNGSGNKVFMHADNGKWFDMDGEKWNSSFICVKDTEMVEVVQMEEHHSGVAEVVMSAAALALLGL